MMLLLDTTAIIIIHPLPLFPTKVLGKVGVGGRLMAGAYPRGQYTGRRQNTPHTCLQFITHIQTNNQKHTHIHIYVQFKIPKQPN